MGTKPDAEPPKRSRRTYPFPNGTFEEALSLPMSIQKHSGGQPIRRITLFDALGKSPDSGPSRQMITLSAKYGLTKGSYSAEILSLTDEGSVASSDESPLKERTRIRAKLAIQDVETFNKVYEKLVGTKMPAKAVLRDAMRDAEVDEDFLEEAVDTFIVNAQFVGLLQTLSGAERFVSIEHLQETLPTQDTRTLFDSGRQLQVPRQELITSADAGFARTCFYVTPIGSEGSEHRRHSDLFLGSLIEPALEPFGLQVIRADAIEKPGLITKQVIQYLMKSRLVIADLSFHNPNVFYELAIRHATRLPTVQVIRKQDSIPFDVNQNRTIQIDCTDIYSLVPQLETYRSQIANQVRRAIDDQDASDNPITLFWPSFQATI